MSDDDWCGPACECALCVQELKIKEQAAEIEAYGRSLQLKQTLIEEQAAEIERLGSVIDATALHWLALQNKHHVPWEGAIDGAMAAACAEIEKLREALRTPLAFIEALHENDPDDQIADNGMTVLDGLKQQAPSVIKTIRAALGETK